MAIFIPYDGHSKKNSVQLFKSPLTKVTLTLMAKLDLDMANMTHHIKNEVSMSRQSKVVAQTERYTHTDRQTHTV